MRDSHMETECTMNVRTLCLGILSFGDNTGYDIKKMSVDGAMSHFIDVSYGSIYPALERLTREGLITCREEQQEGKPDRKVYSITPQGRAALLKALEAEPRADRFKSEFLFRMMFAGGLGGDRVARAMDNRAAYHDAVIAQLEDARQCCDNPSSQFVIGYGLAVHTAAREFLTNNRESMIDLAQGAGNRTEAAE
jgi:DNA-binding PadR family transcriptional regulator